MSATNDLSKMTLARLHDLLRKAKNPEEYAKIKAAIDERIARIGAVPPGEKL